MILTKSNELKLIDFGLSNTYTQGELLSTACGSPCYAAPEMLEGKRYSGALIDIWASGIILYVMLVGQLPFDDSCLGDLYKKIKSGKYKVPKGISKDAKDLIKNILEVNPNVQIILTTHSPAVIMNGWMDKVTEVSDITI